ncbi:tetratricopeptide repeat protein [Jeotgalibacillus proteolyticus]|uniref:Tetratricopeptide repeat protein n=1 Tax=Jeotgalibacillus proteolyticus TaxID=2082395 RepID=A0A2S5GB96_9BACL|nr:tetratricopeptide repeat protein [Jeotgalibacillus proteolyticus]PPA70191.1 tetratricopeptide repeat protein [Jeotgalibacillus proteolyticus]
MKKGSKQTEIKGKIYPFHPTGESYYRRGMAMYQRGQLDKAIKYLKRAHELEPEEPMIPLQVAIIETEIGEFSQSNDRLKHILDKLDSTMTEIHYFMANNFAHLGLFQEAYKHATAYLSQNEDGEFAEDAEDLLELISLEEDEEEWDDDPAQDELIIHQEKAGEMLAEGKFKEAIELLEEVVERFPDYWSAYNNLALAYFYFGETEQATALLTEVLHRNPGNLHALCNLAVFYHYEQRTDELDQLMDALEHVRPFLFEHRFKLGATFALVGRHEKAYAWLKSLVKRGFEGDAGFYFWLSHAAWHSGHEKVARDSWKRVIEEQPEKEGLEPWNGQSIKKDDSLLESMYPEERLFALYRNAGNNSLLIKNNAPSFLTSVEKEYVDLLKQLNDKKAQPSASGPLYRAHEVAGRLNHSFDPSHQPHQGLFYMWFHIVFYGAKDNYPFTNINALAASVEYLWKKIKAEKVSQKEMAQKYDINVSTMRKYLNELEAYLP